jgi:putative membrane protein
MSLAAERTYLAYLRTGLALMAAGVAVAGALPEAGGATLRRIVGLLLVFIAGVLLASARHRWKAVDRAMRRRAPLPRSRVADHLGPALVLIAVAAAVLVLVV